MQPTFSGLYVIADSNTIAPDQLESKVLQAIRGGARMVQYRDKSSTQQQRVAQSIRLRTLCHQNAIPFIINDDAELARDSEADGVHLGRDDSSLEQARKLLGDSSIIGVSCYNDLQRAEVANKSGADYVAFGRFFPSRSKPDAIQAQPELLSEARKNISIPIVAIGGISPDNGAELIDAGASMLAVIHGVFGQQDVEQAAAQYMKLFRHA